MDTATHSILGGKVQLFRRPRSTSWQARGTMGGKQHQKSTGEESLARAKDVATDWYLELTGKYRGGELTAGPTFAMAADKFLKEYEVITLGERNPDYVASHGVRLRVHLLPYFGKKALSEITPGMVQEYRAHRMTSRVDPKTGQPKRPSRTTLHHEIVTFRHVLKTAIRHRWLDYLPDLTTPYKTSGKISHRAWFSPEEYKRLYEATRERAKNPRHNRGRWRTECEDFHDYVLFMVNAGLRPDEAARLQYRDVTVVIDDATKERILEIEVRGKRGVGYCKSMPGAVQPFLRMSKRHQPDPKDAIFGKTPRELMNTVLAELDLKFDREGNRRTAYSLHHTYICMRLMEGADIYQIAKNYRTSVEMIEKYYAAHIKNTLDAAAINVRRAKPAVRKKVPGKQLLDD